MELLDQRTKYQRLAGVLRERLRTQPAAQKLPSVRALMRRFHVSQHTVTSALRLLEDDSLISRRRRSGIYANQTSRPVTICFCRPQNTNLHDDSRESALRAACTERGWRLSIDRFDAARIDRFTQELSADAFVLPAELITFGCPLLGRLIASATPIVMIGRDTGSEQLDFVTGDDAAAIREFLSGLVERGHRHIAYLNCEPPFCEIKQRVEIFLELCRVLNVRSCPVLNVGAEYGWDSIVSSEDYLRRYLINLSGQPLPFTALLTGSISGSIPAPMVFREAGFRIPQDVSLCSLGSDPRARYVIPPLSNTASVHPELADAVLEIVAKRLSGDKSLLLFQRIPYRVVWQESVAAPRQARHPIPLKETLSN